MADPSLVSTSTSSGLSRSQDDLFFNYFLSGEQSMEDDSGPSLPMPLGSGAHASENFLLESLGSPQSEEELLVNSSPYGHSEVSSPSFDAITYEDRLVFQQLWSELAPYGSQAEDPQAFAQSLMMPPPSEESYVSESSPEAEEQGENPKKRKRIRKRTKKEEGPFEPTAVSLPREKLLVLSSKEMQQYVDELRRTRSLTSEEERDIKRQKRLIKNRESALASRTRKKAHVEVLQQQINDINKEKEAMREGLDSLAAENESLKQQVQHLQNVIRKTSFLSELWEKMTAASKRQVRPDQATSSVATATACLFVILFTFGLFFDPVKTNRQLGDKQTSLAETLAGSSFLDEASNTLSSSASSNSLSSSSDSTSSFRTHRKLLGFDEFEDPLATTTTTTTTTMTTTSSSSSSTSSSSSSAASTSSTSADLTDDAVRKPLNASSYVLCSSPHHVTIDEEGASTLPSLVTFFLPADLVRQTVLTMATQLSCQFLDAATMAHITAAANNAANPSINTTE